jgi:hypothetical protein
MRVSGFTLADDPVKYFIVLHSIYLAKRKGYFKAAKSLDFPQKMLHSMLGKVGHFGLTDADSSRR